MVINVASLVMAQFQTNQAGKSVYYRVVNSSNVQVVARTSTGIVEYGAGAYGVMITLATAGDYVVQFDINLTNFKTSVSITVDLPEALDDGIATREEATHFNARQFITRSIIKKSVTANFASPDEVWEKLITYNPDDTIASIEEKRL
jgi:hypothetical protein